MRQRSQLHWSNGVCLPWAIVVYNVEPILDQRRNAIWDDVAVSSSIGVASGHRVERYVTVNK